MAENSGGNVPMTTEYHANFTTNLSSLLDVGSKSECRSIDLCQDRSHELFMQALAIQSHCGSTMFAELPGVSRSTICPLVPVAAEAIDSPPELPAVRSEKAEKSSSALRGTIPRQWMRRRYQLITPPCGPLVLETILSIATTSAAGLASLMNFDLEYTFCRSRGIRA